MSDNKDMEIGRLQARQDATDERLDKLEENMDKRLTNIEKYVQEIRDAANMGRGAWWLLLKIGAVMMAIVGAVTWFLDKMMGKV